ncbi:MAG: hypothetical protein QOE11_3691 [Solirubrobacteraceae bacterium]|jgi:hypothetical protein|nr:hypothetical protein [Solirubrobacteraceae bacterium]
MNTIGSDARDWPAPWQLTAPESHVLAFNGGALEATPFMLAITELIARRTLRLETVDRRRGLKRSREAALYEGADASTRVADSLAPALAAYGAARRRAPDDGVLVADLANDARSEIGPPKRYHERHVVPLLVDQGLLEAGPKRGLRRRPDHHWTTAGRDTEADLQRWLTIGRDDLARWSTHEPATAAAWAHGAGAALLLADELRPHLLALVANNHDSAGAATASEFLDPGWLALDLSALEPLAARGGAFDGLIVDGAGTGGV